MERLAGVIVRWLIRQEAIGEGDRELYEYAAHSFFLIITPFAYALIIGGMMGELKVSLILVIPFAIIRKYSGGFHAKRQWTCLVSSCLLLFGCILAASRIQQSALFDVLVLLSVVWLMVYSPMDSENRRLELWEKKRRKKEVAILSLAFYILYIGLLLLSKERVANSIGVGILLAAGLQVPCVLIKLTKKIRKMSFREKKVEK